MLDFPTEMHCTMQDQDCVCQNKIVEDIRCTFSSEYRLVVIYNIIAKRHAVYFIPTCHDLYIEKDPQIIVDEMTPLPLDLAQMTFPLYGFDENSYGDIP